MRVGGAEERAASSRRALAVALVIVGAVVLVALPVASAVREVPLGVELILGAIAGLVAVAGGIRLLAVAWAPTTRGVRSPEPPRESVNPATPEQLAAVVEAVEHGPELVPAEPASTLPGS